MKAYARWCAARMAKRFVVVNRGAVMHEMVLGTMEDLRQHPPRKDGTQI